MIKLSRIYSETGLFDEVKFRDGLNIILGKYSSTQKEINGIGKSTLIRLIDFCLLSKFTRSKFFNVKTFPFLDGHSVTLEFSTGKESYSVTRWFGRKEVLFARTGTESQNEYPEKELKHILGDIFFEAYSKGKTKSQSFPQL